MHLNSDLDFQREKNRKRIECFVLVFQRVLKRVFSISYIIFLNFCQIMSRYIVSYDETNKVKIKQWPELYWVY